MRAGAVAMLGSMGRELLQPLLAGSGHRRGWGLERVIEGRAGTRADSQAIGAPHAGLTAYLADRA